MVYEDQILSILSSIKADIADLKERQIMIQADITCLKEFRDVTVKSANKIWHGKFIKETADSDPAEFPDSASAAELANKYWVEVFPMLQKAFSGIIFNLLINQLTPLYFKDNLFVLKCDGDYKKKHIYVQCLPEITNCLRKVIGLDIDVRVISNKDLHSKSTNNNITQIKIHRKLLKVTLPS